MPSDFSLRLVKGSRSLSLNSGRFLVGRDFRPPPADVVPLIAEGTSYNRTDGGARIGSRAVDRTLEFSVFIVNVSSTQAVDQAARDLVTFLEAAGSEDEPVFLEYVSGANTDRLPLWGQGGLLRYEVLHGQLTLSDLYATSYFRGRNLPTCPVRLRIKPYAVGKQQRAMSASGGVIVDMLGTSDTWPRGVVIAASAANAFTNPIFESRTPTTGWTAATCLLVTTNYDLAYTLPESRTSVRLASRASASGAYTQNLTLANGSPYVLAAIVKLPDSGTPASTDVQLVRGTTASAGSFFSLGNGFWELSGSVAGTGAASPIGVTVPVSRSVYLAGMQTSPSRRMPFCHGDMLGHSWSSSPHESSSSRANGRLRISASADSFSPVQGAIALVWRPFYDSTFATDQYLFAGGPTAAQMLRLWYESSTDQYSLDDGTTQILSAAQSFSAGCPVHLLATWGGSGIFLYLNGQSTASHSSYTVPPFPTLLYVGTDQTGANHAAGTFMDFRTFDYQVSASEAANDYANCAPLLTDGRQINAIPFLWSFAGDDVAKNANDGTAKHYTVAANIPGTAPAKTVIDALVTQGAGVSLGANAEVWLSNFAAPRFAQPEHYLFFEQGGSGGGYQETGVASSVAAVVNVSSASLLPSMVELLMGRSFYPAMSLYDAGSRLTMTWTVSVAGFTALDGPGYTSLQTASDMRLLRLLPDTIPGRSTYFMQHGFKFGDATEFALRAQRTSGASANVRLDWFALLPRPLLIMGGWYHAPNNQNVVVSGGRAVAYPIGVGGLDKALAVRGDPIEVEPRGFNTLQSFVGSASDNPASDRTLTYNQLLITPRWTLT